MDTINTKFTPLNKMIISNQSIISRNLDILTAEIDGELVMMSVTEGKYYGLGGIASRIWELIETPKSIDDICVDIMSEYEVEHNKCETDIVSFLTQMLDNKIIVLS